MSWLLFVFCRACSVSTGVLHSGLHFDDGLVDQGDRLASMAALVGKSHVQLRTRRPELIKGSLHVRLPTGCTANEITCDKSNDKKPDK